MKTILFDKHLASGAKMTNFCGWEMPLYYKSMIQEHLNVRSHGGVFDLSHMGIIHVKGPQAEKFLDFLCTNKIEEKQPGQAIYTLMCTEKGTCLEDLIVYKETVTSFFLVVNACNRQKVLSHLQYHRQNFQLSLQDGYGEEGILSVQGPATPGLIAKCFPGLPQLRYMHFVSTLFENAPVTISRTGYTGEKGYEILAPNRLILSLWETLVEEGKALQIYPAGLGARDTLRLEMGYALYGHELNETTYPTETVAHWTVQWTKPNFLGKKQLTLLEKSGHRRKQVGVVLKGPSIARSGARVYKNGAEIGKVTSGGFAPSLQQAIAIVLLEKNLYEGDSVEIEIREKQVSAEIVKLPFKEL